jgi:hypothetical protein
MSTQLTCTAGINTNPNPYVRYEQPSQPGQPTLMERFNKPLSSLVKPTQPQFAPPKSELKSEQTQAERNGPS